MVGGGGRVGGGAVEREGGAESGPRDPGRVLSFIGEGGREQEREENLLNTGFLAQASSVFFSRKKMHKKRLKVTGRGEGSDNLSLSPPPPRYSDGGN